jgi:hypothetical protein
MRPAAADKIPSLKILWRQSWRIIPTLYPNRRFLDRIGETKDAPVLLALEQKTNNRVRQEKNIVRYLRPQDHFPRRSSRFLTSPFSYLSDSRFGDGTYGVYYAARECETAIAETRYHREVFMRATHERPQLLRMLALVSRIEGKFHDLRHLRRRYPNAYDPNTYAASQKLAQPLWTDGSQGILYESVRRSGGECAAVFSPQTISHLRQERCLEYEWDGQRIATVSVVQAL